MGRIARQLILTSLILVAMTGNAWAQARFPEGTLVYRIDTLRRLEPQPSSYVDVQFTFYKKGDFTRIETLSVNRADPTDKQRSIVIRNQKGIYQLLETSSALSVDSLAKKLAISRDSLLSAVPILDDFAQFTSYEDEKKDRSFAISQGLVKTYVIKSVGQSSTLLSMPTEKLVITTSDPKDTTEVQVTQKIQVPVGQFFDALQQVKGTPLRFTHSQTGWLYRYTIETINNKPVPEELFRIDPKLKILSTEEMLKGISDIK